MAGPEPPETGQALRIARTPMRLRATVRWAGLALAVAAVLAGLLILARIGWFYQHSHTVGRTLIHRQEQLNAQAQQSGGSSGDCTARPPSANGPRGLIKAASIGLEAPVLEGDGNAQLDVAIGHVPESAWPGPTGTIVLAAHDVSWFSHIDHLADGDAVSFVTPCRTFTYTVTSSQVVQAGTPVYNTLAPRLVLVTCYPLNALFLTSKRYVVFAELTRVAPGSDVGGLPVPDAGTVPPRLPSALASRVRERVTSTAPLGTLGFSGTPAASWEQSLAPIHAEESVLTLFFGAIQVGGQGDSATWRDMAPAVPFAATARLAGARIAYPNYVSALYPTIAVSGTAITGAHVQTALRLTGGRQPGTYDLTMDATVSDGELVITGWTMSRR